MIHLLNTGKVIKLLLIKIDSILTSVSFFNVNEILQQAWNQTRSNAQHWALQAVRCIFYQSRDYFSVLQQRSVCRDFSARETYIVDRRNERIISRVGELRRALFA